MYQRCALSSEFRGNLRAFFSTAKPTNAIKLSSCVLQKGPNHTTSLETERLTLPKMETLYALFGSTFDADPNKRKAAELELRRLEAEDGVLGAAFQIVGSDQADLAVRQAAAM